MLKVGITGGIGTGKTTVCKLFEELAVPVYYADDRAKWLMNHQPDVRLALINIFGKEVYDNKGLLNRKYLSAIVFNNKSKLEQLNAIVHPAVFEDSNNWQKQQEQAGFSYTLKEAALLFETGTYKQLDKIIVVTAPETLRISRVMLRDKVSKEEVEKRIKSQLPQAEKEARADFLIQNIELEKLFPQIHQIHQQLLQLAAMLAD